jgi:hypothetical protein
MTTHDERTPVKTTTWHRNAALILPLLLVNSAAIYGQSGWAYDHLGHSWTVAVLFAVAVESIGVFLAAEAHAALMAGHASGALRLGSYAVGALVGSLNYGHFASTGYRPNPLAVTFGLLSSISPWLWAIRSRSMNRARLYELGLIDPRAVKFSRLRWALFPLRTFAAFRAAVWAGVQRPDEAVAAADERRATRRANRAGTVPSPATPAPAEAVPSGVGRPLTLTAPAQVPAAVVAEVRRELTAAPVSEPAARLSTRTPPRKTTGKRGKGKRSPGRSAEETRALAAQLRTRQPGITQAEIAKLLGISPTRLRTVERAAAGPVNGTDLSGGTPR